MGKGSERREYGNMERIERQHRSAKWGPDYEELCPPMLRSLDLNLGKSRVTEGLPQPNSAIGREL